jgi:hypothetical protein
MKRIALSLVLAAVCISASAQGTAMDFIRSDRNPATLGTAGAGYASVDMGTAFSAFGNPAAISLAGHMVDAAGTFGMAPAGDGKALSYGGGASLRLGSFGVSAGYIGTAYPKIPFFSEGGGASGSFAPSEMTVGLGLSYAIGDFLSFGALARYASSALDSKTTLTSFSADVMAMYRHDALTVSAGVASLGPKVASVANRSYPLPSSVRVGAAYKLGLGDFAVDFLADGDYYWANGTFGVAAGVQGGFRDMAFLRVGYRYSSVREDFSAAPVPSGFSAGAGVRLFGIGLDLAYILNSGTGGALVAGLSYRFGQGGKR